MTDIDAKSTLSKLAALEARIEAIEKRVGARQPSVGKGTGAFEREKTAFDPEAWQKTLSTPGGVARVASALATHIRRVLQPHGPRALPRDLDVGRLDDDASAAKIVEVLEACSARLREFEPEGASEIDLSPLGASPFQTNGKHVNLACSFCGKAQRDVTKLIAGPCVYICNECVDLSVSIINEG